MKLDISSPMIQAFKRGDDNYTPTFDGVDLELERGDAAVTLRNLDEIVGTHRPVRVFYLAKGQVLVIFETGETYLATGFGYGHEGDEVFRFALFAAKCGYYDGNHEELFKTLSRMNPVFYGPLDDKSFPSLRQFAVIDE